jgi:hypothetical protein
MTMKNAVEYMTDGGGGGGEVGLCRRQSSRQGFFAVCLSLLVTTNAVLSSLILSTLKIEATRSSRTSVQTKATSQK